MNEVQDSMPISQGARLALYIGMSILPVWIDFFVKSSDFSLRGLSMPALSSALAAITVTLARTTAKKPTSDSTVQPPQNQPQSPPESSSA